MISMYKTSYDGRTYFVYWLPEPKVMGVCNGASEIYELNVSEKDRAEFVNVTETILPTIWREIMCNKAFNLSSISESNCTVTFGTKKSLTLPVNNDPLRLAFIMEEMLKCIETLTGNQEKQQKKKAPPVVPVKRRKPPTRGIKWEED